MIPDERRKPLIAVAEQLARDLGAFKTPGSGDPVDPSRLAEVFRYVKENGTKRLPELLTLLPGSYLRKASASAGPQLKEVQRRCTPIAQKVKDPEELAFVLGWARRCMAMAEKSGASEHGRRRESGRGRRR